MSSLPGLPPSTAEAESKADPIEEMVGALTDPIIVFPSGGWENDIPEWMRRDLPLHRLAHLMKCSQGKANWNEATDLEALMYLYPASLAAPMDEEWSRIYLYLGTKVMGEKMPGDIKEESLPSHYEQDLQELKRWIYRKKAQARKERLRKEKTGKADQKEQIEPVKCEQLKFF